jgi:CRP-like cAMP-binding protein
VTAIGEVEVLVLQRDRFHSLVQQRPGVLMQLCTTLVRRLRLAEQAIPAAIPSTVKRAMRDRIERH